MIQWLRKFKAQHIETKKLRIEEEKHKENVWEISIGPSYIWLAQPYKLFNHSLINEWAKLQVNVLSKIQEKLLGAHTYIQVASSSSQLCSDLIVSCHPETFTTRTGKGKGFLFPDCQDKQVWERLLVTPTLTFHPAKSIFMLDGTPIDWRDIITEIYEIVGNAHNLNSIDKNKWPFSKCRCLCFVEDADLLFEKVDLSDEVLLSIFENEAQKNGFDLVVSRE
jgi:hypothetical protein